MFRYDRTMPGHTPLNCFSTFPYWLLLLMGIAGGGGRGTSGEASPPHGTIRSAAKWAAK